MKEEMKGMHKEREKMGIERYAVKERIDSQNVHKTTRWMQGRTYKGPAQMHK